MNKLDLLKFFSQYEGEVSEADFTVSELVDVTSNTTTKDSLQIKKEFEDDYFSYYDDVKDRVRGHEDW